MDKPSDWNDVAARDPNAVLEAFDSAAIAVHAVGRQRRWMTASNLQTKKFEPIKFIVEGYIAEGCTLFAGRPKIGKSWLMLEIAVAVANGTACLGGIRCQRGDVLYLALEDNERRLQQRLTKLIGATREKWPESLCYATEWPRLRDGGVQALREWIETAKNPTLIVVDVLAMVRSPGRAHEVYQADYDTVKSLQQISLETGVAIVIVTHVRKGGADGDPFEKVSGTLGLSGAADTVLILDRDGNGATLYARGRDIEEIETAVSFDKETCRWQVLGEASEVRRTDARSKIIAALQDAHEPLTPAEIAIATENTRNNVDQLLFKMVKDGEVLKVGRGKYVHPERTDLLETAKADKNDKKIRKANGNSGSEAGGEVIDLTSYRSYPAGGERSQPTAASAESSAGANQTTRTTTLSETLRDGLNTREVVDKKRSDTGVAGPAAAEGDDLAIPEFLDRAKHPRPGDPNWSPPN